MGEKSFIAGDDISEFADRTAEGDFGQPEINLGIIPGGRSTGRAARH